MHFQWSPQDIDFFESTVKFAQTQLNDDLETRFKERHFSRALWQACGEFGLLGLCIPDSYGGLGLNCLQTARIMEAFGYGCRDQGLVFSASAHLFACLTSVEAFADEKLKKKYLPALCDGSQIAAHAISEVDAGSDAGNLKTKAVRDNGHYIINGSKLYVSNAGHADVFIVYANVRPEWGYLGISAFIVERNTPGISIGQSFEKPGLLTTSLAPVYFDDCRVPAENLIGEEGVGMKAFAHSMVWERSCLLAGFLGATKRTLEYIIEHAANRCQSRQAIGKNQSISHRIADLSTQYHAAQLLLYKACWSVDQGQDSTEFVAMAKLAISENAIETGLAAVQILGGQGYTYDGNVIQFLQDALPTTIFSGTSEIQRNLIASQLGL